MQHRLRAVRRLDDDVRLRESERDVAARRLTRIGRQLLSRDGLLGIEQRLEHVVLHVQQAQRGVRLADGVGGDGRDRLALKVTLSH